MRATRPWTPRYRARVTNACRRPHIPVTRRAEWKTATLVGRLFERLEKNEPALAVGARAAGKGDGECEIERRDLPALLGATRVHRDGVRLQQIVRRGVVAVLVLHVVENREFASRSHVDFEFGHPI